MESHSLNWSLLKSASSPSSLLEAFAARFPPPPLPPLQTHRRFDLNQIPFFEEELVPASKNIPNDDGTLLTLALPSLPSQQVASYKQCMYQGCRMNDPTTGGRSRWGKQRLIPVQQRKETKCKVPQRWTEEEDRELEQLVRYVGEQKWSKIGNMMKNRKGKQCRERWNNHLRPDIMKHARWTKEEEEMIVEIHKKEGSKWSKLGKILQGRTENSIKNHWNSTKRKVISSGTFLESSPLQCYIGLASGCTPWKLPTSNESSVGSNFQAQHASTATTTTTTITITTTTIMEEVPQEELVMFNFFE